MMDSKSDFNWIAPAHELVRICKKASFPEEYETAEANGDFEDDKKAYIESVRRTIKSINSLQ